MTARPEDQVWINIREAFSGWDFTWHSLIRNSKGEWWLILQCILILAHLASPWPNIKQQELYLPLYIKVIGFTLFLWGSILAMKSFICLGRNLSPFPDPKKNSELVINGSYKTCRHPLYRALIICSAGTVIGLGSLFHLFLLLSLCITLKGKAKREESKLKIIFPEYNSYMNITPSIIPNIPFLDWRS